MILKVKEPVPEEYGRLREGQILFTYLHLAASQGAHPGADRSQGLGGRVRDGADARRRAPAPRADERGRRPDGAARRGTAAGEGARRPRHPDGRCLRACGRRRCSCWARGWRARTPRGSPPGWRPRSSWSTRTSTGLRFIDQIHKGRIITLMSDRLTLEQRVREADVVVGSVLVPGARAPKLVTEEMVASMRPGSVIVDIAIDQGGCVETARMTTHSDPTYVEHGVVHYCVGNMPGAVPNTSTYALTNVTLPYALDIATKGLERAVARRPGARARRERVRRRGHERGGGRGPRPCVRPARRRGARLTARGVPVRDRIGTQVRALPRSPAGRARPVGQHDRRVPAGPRSLRRRSSGPGRSPTRGR